MKEDSAKKRYPEALVNRQEHKEHGLEGMGSVCVSK